MGKYFSATARYAKPWEFLKPKQGMMIVLEYVAKFTELARFADDYMATDMAKVRKFKDGLKLSIHGKIMRFLLQDMDSMVRTTMAIERETDDARSIHDAGVSDKKRENQSSSSSGKKQRTSASLGFQGQGRGYQSQGQVGASSQMGQMTCYHCYQPGHMRRDFPWR